MDEARVYPNLNRIKEVSFKIAVDVGKYANENGLCHIYPTIDSLEKHIRNHVYVPDYKNQLHEEWSWSN